MILLSDSIASTYVGKLFERALEFAILPQITFAESTNKFIILNTCVEKFVFPKFPKFYEYKHYFTITESFAALGGLRK